MYLYSTCIYINIHNTEMSMYAYIQSNLNRTYSLCVSTLRCLHFVSRDEISRDDRADRTDNPEDHTYQKANEELNILRECSRLTFWLMKFLGIIFRPRDIAQPIDESIGRRIESVAYCHGDLSRVFAISHCLVDLVHYLRDLHDRGVIVRDLHGACETQVDRASCIARLVSVPRQTYQRRPVKGSFQEFRIGTMTQHHSGSTVTCNNEATVLRGRECLHAIAALSFRARLFNSMAL